MDETKLRILSLLDQITIYYRELEKYLPKSFKEYSEDLEKKRFCERTLQLLIECCIDLSQLLVKNLNLGIPSEEENIFDKLEKEKVISKTMSSKLKDMKKFRNVLIHKYTDIIDKIVFEHATKQRKDFLKFKEEIVSFFKRRK